MLRHQSNGRRMTHSARCPFGKQVDPLDPAWLIDLRHPGHPHGDDVAVVVEVEKPAPWTFLPT
jgi:hypothetical protein